MTAAPCSAPAWPAAVPAVLEDLARVNTATVTTDPVLSAIPSLVFDHDAALTRSAGIARQLTRAGLLTRDDRAQAGRLLAHQQHTPMIVNNSDFYPRNLMVQQAGRIVIIDWETYNPNSPFHTVDHPENVAAVFYAHMWGNPAWQAAYRSALDQRLGFSGGQLRQRWVIRHLELANMWMNDTDLDLRGHRSTSTSSPACSARRPDG